MCDVLSSKNGGSDMGVVISLSEIVEAIETQSNDGEAYLDPDTGEIVLVTEDDRRFVEEGRADDELLEWQRETMPRIREALTRDRFLILPDRFEVHEWAIMERFSQEQNQQAQVTLSGAIHGPGAFRRFRSAVERLGLLDAWYLYREEAINQIARDWLEEHKLAYK
ncbi:MAG TPA: UPF0158 family protein [Candidatus Angelobacter sp.]|jgi:hypothetical protein|nr:UPF0158 family protein [Candidatus Angelobacter sp.]